MQCLLNESSQLCCFHKESDKGMAEIGHGQKGKWN